MLVLRSHGAQHEFPGRPGEVATAWMWPEWAIQRVCAEICLVGEGGSLHAIGPTPFAKQSALAGSRGGFGLLLPLLPRVCIGFSGGSRQCICLNAPQAGGRDRGRVHADVIGSFDRGVLDIWWADLGLQTGDWPLPSPATPGPVAGRRPPSARC